MVTAGRTRPELICSGVSSDYSDIAAPLPPSPELYVPINPDHRMSAVSVGVYEYVAVDVPGQTCLYQQLDISLLEEHIYHNFLPNTSLK